MKLAIALFSALTLLGYAAAAVPERLQNPLAGPDPSQEPEMSNDLEYGDPSSGDDHPTAEKRHASIQNSTSQRITVNSLTCGAVKAVYRSPNHGRVVLNLLNSNNDTLIHIDARFNLNILVLNSKAVNGGWQQEAHPNGFPFPCCRYVTTITLHVKIGAECFIITANGLEIASYPYRGALRPPVDKITYTFEDTGASVKAKLESLTVEY